MNIRLNEQGKIEIFEVIDDKKMDHLKKLYILYKKLEDTVSDKMKKQFKNEIEILKFMEQNDLV